MGGFDKNRSIDIFNIPQNYRPIVMIAIGYPQHLKKLPEIIQEKENASRTRKRLDEIAYLGSLMKPYRQYET